jgi:hypothetical protein
VGSGVLFSPDGTPDVPHGPRGLSGVIVGGQVARALNLPQRWASWCSRSRRSPPRHDPGHHAVQGREIGSETYRALQARLRTQPPGSAITVEVLRDGQRVSLEAAAD